MLGPLTYAALTAMTRDRLEAIDRMLLEKIRSQQNVSALERQVRFLAKTAHESMSLPPHLPEDGALPRFARRLSLHTVFGASGPSFPKYAAMLAPGQRWLFDTIHGGTPDPDRERVLARSTDVLLKVAERGTALINASDAEDKPAELRKLRAYVFGHTCHIAADLVTAPFVHAIAYELGDGTRARLTPEQVVAAMETASARLFGSDVTQLSQQRRGRLYQDWLLKPRDLPHKIFDAYKEALESAYGPGARPQLRPPSGASTPPPQVSRPFWQQFESAAPPALSADLLADGYATYRSVMDSSWTFGDWLGATAIIFFPPIAAYPLIVAMPHTRALFKDNATVDGEAVDTELGWFGLAMAPLATSALAPVALSVFLAAFTRYGVVLDSVLGWVAGGINLITSLVFLGTIGQDVDAGVRWGLLFIIPFVLLLAHAIFVLVHGTSDARSQLGLGSHHTLLALGSLIPCIITAVYILFHLAWHQSQDLGMNGWLKETDGKREEWGNGGFIGGWILWAFLLIGSWVLVSWLLQLKSDSEPAHDRLVSGEKHFLRMFGHGSLMFDPDLATDAAAERALPSLATHYFPTDRTPLLKIWWEGGGELWMRSDRNALRFSTAQDGTGDPQTVLAPAAPMTAAEYAAFLTKAVKEGPDFTQNLKAEPFDTDEFDYVLSTGVVFADAGDEKATRAEHETEAAKFFRLPTSSGDATVLYHAPRSHMAGFYGSDGAVDVDAERGVAVAGAGQATFGATVTGDAATRFTTLFRRGDVIATTGISAGNESRTVVSVPNDRLLTVTSPFTAAVGGAPRTYQRAANTREADFAAGTLQATATFRVYQGAGVDAIFLPGDLVRTVPAAPGAPEERTVVQVLSATQIMVDKPFASVAPGAPAGVPCVRVGRASREGFAYAPVSPAAAFDGESILDRAADLAAVLCMGAATHVASASERQAVTTGLDEDRRPAVNPVYQVFRNWNLNQRRVNEWQMLVGGRAISEKRGTPASADPLQPGAPSSWTAPTPAGEPIANDLGWVPLMKRWLDVASQPGIDALATDALRSGNPTNRQLSEGIAFLFDLPMPA